MTRVTAVVFWEVLTKKAFTLKVIEVTDTGDLVISQKDYHGRLCRVLSCNTLRSASMRKVMFIK